MYSMKNLLNIKYIDIILSVIWGLGLACLFKKVCSGRDCIQYTSPDISLITNNIWRKDNKCFKYTTKNVECKGDTIK